MSTETDGISIPRKLVRIGVLTRDAIFCKGSIPTNLMLNGEEIEQLPYVGYMADEVRGILFGVNQDNMAVDLLNNGYEYPVMNITKDLKNQQKKYNNWAVASNYPIESLLKYLGFKEEITAYELQLLSKLLESKRQIKKLALPCSYGRINIRKTDIWDYQQQLKLGRNYYKFISNNNFDNERCVFDKAVYKNLKQQIFPAAIFAMLVKNQKLGYIAHSNLRDNDSKKVLIRK